LLIEWPKDEDEPTKYWLSTLPRNISFGDLVDATKLRWRIERDYQELKQEIGLGHPQVAIGANPQQTLQAFREAEAYEGPSLILAYSHCIAHGFDLRYGMKQQDLATASGYWPLFRYNPILRKIGENPFRLDSPRPTIALEDYAYNELRYRGLELTRPAEAGEVLRQAQAAVEEKYRTYEEFASLGRGPTPTQVTTAVAKALGIGNEGH
jgi:hypothetical protein